MATGIAVTRKTSENKDQKSNPNRMVKIYFQVAVLKFIKIRCKNNFGIKFVIKNVW